MSTAATWPERPIRSLALTAAPCALLIAPSAMAGTYAGGTIALSGSVATNPDLRPAAETGVSGVISLSPWLRHEGERSRVTLSGYVEYEKYANIDRSNFTAWTSLNLDRRLTERLSVSGTITYRQTDTVLQQFLAQGAASVPGGGSGGVELPPASLPDVTFGGTPTRSNMFDGSFSLKAQPSARGELTAGAGFKAARYAALNGSDQNQFASSLGYKHKLSERTSIYALFGYTHFDYLGTRVGDGWAIAPQVGFSRQIGETLTLEAGAGASVSQTRRLDGSERRFTAFSGQVTLCKAAQNSKYCLTADRSVQSTAVGGSTVANAVRFNLARNIGARNLLSADVQYVRYGRPTELTVANRVSDFWGFSTSLTHRFSNRRLSGAISPSFVRLNDNNGARTNFQVRLSVRYNFGGRS